MLAALLWGLIATSSLVVGGVVGTSLDLGKRTLGVIMAFGAGILISAVSYELVYESMRLAHRTLMPTLGFFCGAFVFFTADLLIGKLGERNRTSIDASPSGSELAVPMTLAIILDGVPESMVIGIVMLEGGGVSWALLAAVFVSNVPEAITGTKGLQAGGRSRSWILLFWSAIALLCALCTVVGYAFFGNASNELLAFVQAFAGGAILMMLANTMIPEAFEHGGRLAGVFTVLGFWTSLGILLLESSI